MEKDFTVQYKEFEPRMIGQRIYWPGYNDLAIEGDFGVITKQHEYDKDYVWCKWDKRTKEMHINLSSIYFQVKGAGVKELEYKTVTLDIPTKIEYNGRIYNLEEE